MTVLMSAFNASRHITEAIASVLGQTFEDLELLVVDDASTDSTSQLVRSHADPRVRLISLEQNSGAGTARNHGMRMAKADLIAVQDADDISYPERLARQVAYMEEHPDCGLLGSDFDLIDEAGRIQSTVASPCDTPLIRWRLLTENVVANSSVMMRRKDALAVGGYNEGLRFGEDYSLWTAMAPVTAVAQLPEVLIAYRDNPAGLSRTQTTEHQLEAVRIARHALSRAAGRNVSFEAVRCLCGLPSADQAHRAACLEAARALADALEATVTRDPTAHGFEPALLRDWRRQVERLCVIAPSVLPSLVALSIRLSLATVGIRGLGAGCPTWLFRSFAFSMKGLLKKARRPHEISQE